MTTLTKKRNPDIKIFSYGNSSKIKNRSKEKLTNALLTDLQRAQSDKKMAVVNLKLNQNWMQDWMEQLNFLRINLTVLSLLANDINDFCYYEDTSVIA